MTVDWRHYQQEAAEFFRALGMTAGVDVKLKGARTTHNVDVVVRSKHVGFEILWLVECKLWKSPVSKLHVLGLREIVTDVGADRGILLCEAGFQSGAIEAATLTNVHVSSLAKLSLETRMEVSAMRLRDIDDRVATAKTLYWDLDKTYRIKVGLRPDTLEYGYSGSSIIQYFETVLGDARLQRFPIRMGEYGRIIGFDLPKVYHSFDEIAVALEPILADLEKWSAPRKVVLPEVGF